MASGLKDWHYPDGDDFPVPGLRVYAVIEESTEDPTEPRLVEASCDVLEERNPPLMWKVYGWPEARYLLVGSWNVVAWRYKDPSEMKWVDNKS